MRLDSDIVCDRLDELANNGGPVTSLILSETIKLIRELEDGLKHIRDYRYSGEQCRHIASETLKGSITYTIPTEQPNDLSKKQRRPLPLGRGVVNYSLNLEEKKMDNDDFDVSQKMYISCVDGNVQITDEGDPSGFEYIRADIVHQIVERAFREGFDEGRDEDGSAHVNSAWKYSDTKRSIENDYV